jgi:hypothetical protein
MGEAARLCAPRMRLDPRFLTEQSREDGEPVVGRSTTGASSGEGVRRGTSCPNGTRQATKDTGYSGWIRAVLSHRIASH